MHLLDPPLPAPSMDLPHHPQDPPPLEGNAPFPRPCVPSPRPAPPAPLLLRVMGRRVQQTLSAPRINRAMAGAPVAGGALWPALLLRIARATAACCCRTMLRQDDAPAPPARGKPSSPASPCRSILQHPRLGGLGGPCCAGARAPRGQGARGVCGAGGADGTGADAVGEPRLDAAPG